MKKLIVFCVSFCLTVGVYAQQASDFRKATEQGNAEAQYSLADCYYNGKGVTKDYAQAVNWYRKRPRDKSRLSPFSHC